MKSKKTDAPATELTDGMEVTAKFLEDGREQGEPQVREPLDSADAAALQKPAEKRKKIRLEKKFMTDEPGHWFAISQCNSGRKLNFWQVTPEHIYLYSYTADKRFRYRNFKSVRHCWRLLDELRSEHPSVEVFRFAVDGKMIMRTAGSSRIPRVPTPPTLPIEPPPKPKKPKSIREAIEIEKCKEPAPYILYGVFPSGAKEYAWRLTPDKPKRQNIQPGDPVLVWTRKGFKTVKTVRIEPAGDKMQPTCRVKRKLDEFPENFFENGREPQDVDDLAACQELVEEHTSND